ncbi:MAG: hypothetical protein R6U03_00120 [Gillisia sp.]
MENSVSNLEFQYLHRDEGNYKIHGSIIFKNTLQIKPTEANELIKEKLIDGEYFYPKDVKIPLFQEHADIGTFFTDWYEFDKFSLTDENPSDSRSILEFINSFED